MTGDATHTPCCSSHGVEMTCERYRKTHFVEVRPCCSIDADVLRQERLRVQDSWAAPGPVEAQPSLVWVGSDEAQEGLEQAQRAFFQQQYAEQVEGVLHEHQASLSVWECDGCGTSLRFLPDDDGTDHGALIRRHQAHIIAALPRPEAS